MDLPCPRSLPFSRASHDLRSASTNITSSAGSPLLVFLRVGAASSTIFNAAADQGAVREALAASDSVLSAVLSAGFLVGFVIVSVLSERDYGNGDFVAGFDCLDYVIYFVADDGQSVKRFSDLSPIIDCESVVIDSPLVRLACHVISDRSAGLGFLPLISSMHTALSSKNTVTFW